MQNSKSREDLATLVEQRRKELSERPDISSRMRALSESNSRNPVPVFSRRRPRMVTLVLLGVGFLLLVGIIAAIVTAVASALWVHNSLNDPVTVVEDYYSSLKTAEYSQAYSYYSTHAQQQIAELAFTDKMSAYDRISGGVQTFVVTNEKVSGNSATLTVDVVRRSNATSAQVELVQMVNENGHWRIDSVTPNGSVPAPTTGPGNP